MSNSSKFEKRKVKFFDGLEIDGYMMPDGSFRVDLSGTSKMLGYSQQWLSQGISRGGTLLKALRGLGFSGQIEKTETLRGKNAQTISLKDFQRVMLYAVQQSKPQAVALQLALTDMALTDFFRDAFGLRALSIDEKRAAFYQAFAKTLTTQDWLDWDRQDAQDIDDHIAFLNGY